MAKKIPKEAVLTFLKITRDAIDMYLYNNMPRKIKPASKPKKINVKFIEERTKK
jgi:hypothetical protein